MWSRDEFVSHLKTDIYGYYYIPGIHCYLDMVYILTFGLVNIEFASSDDWVDAETVLNNVLDYWELVTGTRFELDSDGDLYFNADDSIIDLFMSNNGMKALQDIEDGTPWEDIFA